jgi:hypothetical protein
MTHDDRPIGRGAFLRTLGAAFGVALLPGRLRAAARDPLPHPEPRPGITAERVPAADTLPDRRKLRAAYASARAHPAIFDGLYCGCGCPRGMGHRSLLACFETTHAGSCYGCIEEAALAGRLAGAGKSLAEIRQAVDAEFGA